MSNYFILWCIIFNGYPNQLTQNPLNQSTINLSVNMPIHYPPKLTILHIVGGVVKLKKKKKKKKKKTSLWPHMPARY